MKAALRRRKRGGWIVVSGVAAGLCGCASPNYREAEARRLESERERHPALYELERDLERRHSKSLEDYQRQADNYWRNATR